MPYLNINPKTKLYFKDIGQGTPVIFIHGVWMNSNFFKEQVPYFKDRYRLILPDLRAHGRSSHVHKGHTMATYANDIHALIQTLGLQDVVLVGWSMGAFVMWEYIKQFGTANLKASVVVSESASDYRWPDWNIGAFDFAGLIDAMHAVQTDRAGFVQAFVPLMFKDAPSQANLEWMVHEVTKLPESIASSILFGQTVVDYRPMLSTIDVPTLLCFGRDEKLIPVAAATHLEQNIPDTQLVMFENSSHCPFLEEPQLFNETVDNFIQSLGGSSLRAAGFVREDNYLDDAEIDAIQPTTV
ncbi:alpha/beta fold hydrolase [Paenibacillus sedimenti]|uniref:Alpha/beta hydrolase n=1 Tax=Paenibacillus sedimenti TaxID=2770274 RepID=A0A926KWY2_9BACL|nr:alpha/beta hydrolase [Paenibacillus sedimenti]MBD0384381.1 alpha/beta hydrolase [Paenibacillus sedimenti]